MGIGGILSQSYVLNIKFNSSTDYLLVTIISNSFVAPMCWAIARSFSGKKTRRSL